MAETAYAKPIAHADIKDCRIERIFVKEEQQEEIRLSWWPGGRFAPRPLDIPEADLLDLMAAAIRQGVFTPSFVTGLRSILSEASDA